MEIKVGDKVRVSKDAPEMYFFGCNYDNSVCKVILVDRDNAVITQVKNGSFAIPAKYLTKVEDEAKEPKFKVGDVVRIKPDADKLHQGYQNGYAWLPERDNYLGRVASVKEIWCDGSIILNIGSNLMWGPIDLEPYTEPTTPTIKVGDVVRCKSPLRLKNSTDDDFIGTVTDVENGWFIVHMNNGAVFQACNAVDLELVQPKEQTEEAARIRQMEAELDEFRKAELDKVLHPEKYHTYEVTIDNVAMNWQRYEADLAKEIAVKLSKPNENKPGYVADYAVSVAKAVVENLKKK